MIRVILMVVRGERAGGRGRDAEMCRGHTSAFESDEGTMTQCEYAFALLINHLINLVRK